MERNEKLRLVEALILGSPEPVSPTRLADLLPRGKPALVRELVDELNAEYAQQGRSFEIWSVAGGYQIRTLAEFAPYLQQLQPSRPLRMSRAALETLAIVAYRQPVTRAEIEQIRGVDAGAVLRSLVERKMVRIAGHREVPGRPMLYATSRRFLEVFGLERLDELPTLRDLDELPGQATGTGSLDAVPEALDDGPQPDSAFASELEPDVEARLDGESDEALDEAFAGDLEVGAAPELAPEPASASDPAADFFVEVEPTGKPH